MKKFVLLTVSILAFCSLSFSILPFSIIDSQEAMLLNQIKVEKELSKSYFLTGFCITDEEDNNYNVYTPSADVTDNSILVYVNKFGDIVNVSQKEREELIALGWEIGD